jgi:hypothetical protein
MVSPIAQTRVGGGRRRACHWVPPRARILPSTADMQCTTCTTPTPLLCIDSVHSLVSSDSAQHEQLGQHDQAACALTTQGPAAWCSRRGAPAGVRWWVLVGTPRLAAPRNAGWPAAAHGCWGAAVTQPPVTNDDNAVAISKGGDTSKALAVTSNPVRQLAAK